MTQKQISIAGIVVAVIGVAIAYFTLQETQAPSASTTGKGSPIIQGSSDVTINNN
jgi:hypothetical protein